MRWVLLSLFFVAPAWAGDRQIEVALVRLDDGSDPEAKACFGRIRSAFAGDYSIMRPVISRAKFLEKTGAAHVDDLLSWPIERILAALPTTPQDHSPLDAFVLIDCRPGAGRLHAVVLSGTGAADTPKATQTRFVINGLEKGRFLWITQQLRAAAWLDFSP